MVLCNVNAIARVKWFPEHKAFLIKNEFFSGYHTSRFSTTIKLTFYFASCPRKNDMVNTGFDGAQLTQEEA